MWICIHACLCGYAFMRVYVYACVCMCMCACVCNYGDVAFTHLHSTVMSVCWSIRYHHHMNIITNIVIM